MFLALARPNCHSQLVLICSSLWRRSSHNIRFQQAKPQSSKSGNSNTGMESNDNNNNHNNQKNGDAMSHSFGEGYSTRSDEEGFGGIYRGNQSLRGKKDEIHENHPDYDKSQGSDVKEKEKGRNTTGSSD